MSYGAPANPAACPSDEELMAWLCGELPAPALSVLLGHTEQCPACALVVAEAGLVRGESEAAPRSRLAAGPGAVFEAGQVVASRYAIERRLGRGGMGEVYVALDRELNERVALKTVSTALAAEPSAVERLKQELRLARRVSHPHVCRVLELGRHELKDALPQWFFTLQLIEGESLRRRLLRGQPPALSESLVWAEQLARGLAAIHDQSVIHRDIKPENVMLTSTGSPADALWVDFGLARVDLTDTLSPGLLQGTPDYAAPELLRGAVASRASDLYAFGVLLHELFVGSLPFPRLSAFTAPREREAGAVLAPSPALPPELDALVRQCLENAPEARPASADEVAERLQDVQLVVEGGLRQRPRFRWLLGGFGAGALIAGLVLLHAASSHPAAPEPHDDDLTVAPSLKATPGIASTPAAPAREAASPRSTTRRLASATASASASAVPAPTAPAPSSEPRITDFGGRR